MLGMQYGELELIPLALVRIPLFLGQEPKEHSQALDKKAHVTKRRFVSDIRYLYHLSVELEPPVVGAEKLREVS